MVIKSKPKEAKGPKVSKFEYPDRCFDCAGPLEEGYCPKCNRRYAPSRT